MYTVYIYILDTLADWEIGHVTAELNSKRFFKKDAPTVIVKTVSCSREKIRTMGGMKLIPDCLISDIAVDESSVLILPGADTWNDAKHLEIIKKAKVLMDAGGMVCGICGATVALANAGLLDRRAHTSNGPGFLEIFSTVYKGKDNYIDEACVTDDHLITASCTGSLMFAKQILEKLGVYKEDTLKAWYDYFSSGKSECFFELMQTLQ